MELIEALKKIYNKNEFVSKEMLNAYLHDYCSNASDKESIDVYLKIIDEFDKEELIEMKDNCDILKKNLRCYDIYINDYRISVIYDALNIVFDIEELKQSSIIVGNKYKAGDVIKLGVYKGEQLEWKVLRIYGNSALVLCTKIVAILSFFSYGKTDEKYNGSNVKKFLLDFEKEIKKQDIRAFVPINLKTGRENYCDGSLFNIPDYEIVKRMIYKEDLPAEVLNYLDDNAYFTYWDKGNSKTCMWYLKDIDKYGQVDCIGANGSLYLDEDSEADPEDVNYVQNTHGIRPIAFIDLNKI